MAKKSRSEDQGLWDRVKRTVDPLDEKQRQRYSQALADYLADHPEQTPKPNSKDGAPKPTAAPSSPSAKQSFGQPSPKPAAQKRTLGQPPLIDFDRKTRSKIARGRTPIDARLDLHGLRQHEAQDVLRSFIWRSHSAGHRTVLVITGKGSRARDPGPEAPPWAMGTGILKRAVPGWLSAADMRAAVLSVEPANATHGGEGALYVRLRAKRSQKP